MLVQLSLIVLAFVATCTAIYTIYKILWYTVKMSALHSIIKEYDDFRCKIEFCGSLKNVIFSKKGALYFTITTPKGKFEVSLLSSISTHSRWNIEKASQGHFLEVRKYNNVFYKVENNSSTAPEHAKDYRRESRFKRCELYLTPKNEEYKKQFLLVYPQPKLLTYTTTRLDYLIAGSKIDEHEIIFAEDLLNILEHQYD